MAYIGAVRVNGSLRTTVSVLVGDGTVSATSPGYAKDPDTGFIREQSGVVDFVSNGLPTVQLGLNVGVAADAFLAFAATAAASGGAQGSKDTVIAREAANTFKFFDGSTTASTVLLGSIDIRQAASTFAQTATITNGPRAANPVAWIEVKVSGSTGRIPVW